MLYRKNRAAGVLSLQEEKGEEEEGSGESESESERGVEVDCIKLSAGK